MKIYLEKNRMIFLIQHILFYCFNTLCHNFTYIIGYLQFFILNFHWIFIILSFQEILILIYKNKRYWIIIFHSQREEIKIVRVSELFFVSSRKGKNGNEYSHRCQKCHKWNSICIRYTATCTCEQKRSCSLWIANKSDAL